MPDPADIFADGLRVYMGAYGCALHFHASTEEEHRSHAETPEKIIEGTRVATVRLSPEFVKGMVFYLYQRVRQYEKEGGPISLPTPTLQRLTEGDRDTWDRLWSHSQ